MNHHRNSRLFILLVVLLTALSYFPLSELKFDFNLEKLFPVNDPELDFFTDFQKRFYTEIDDEYLLIALRNNKGIFQQQFLEKADSLTRYLSSLENILAVYSVTNIPSVSMEEGNLVQAPLIHIDQPALYATDSANLFGSEEYRDLMFSRDGKILALTALNRPNLTDSEKDALINGIEQQVGLLGFDQANVVGKIKVERAYVKEIAENLIRYLIISFMLIAIVLAVLYRSFTGVIIPLITIMVATCWTLALISLMGFPLDIISSLLPPVLAVICMSDIVHITTKYIEESRKGLTRTDALSNTFHSIGLATLFTSITTAAGFYSLSVSNVSSIRSFGFFAGTGVLIALVVALGTMLSVYDRSPVPKVVHMKYLDDRWHKYLSIIYGWLVPRKGLTAGIFLLLMVPSAYFISRIEINSSLLAELPKDDPLLDDYALIENEFAGTRSFEMALILKDTASTFLKPGTLRHVEEVERFLRDSLGVGNLFTPATFIKGANRALRGGDAKDWRLPEYQQDVFVCFDKLLFSPVGKDMIRYITQDGKHARIGGKLPNLSLKEVESLNRRFDRYFGQRSRNFEFTYKLTGSALLIDKVSYSVIRNLFTGLAIGFCVISLIVIVMFRSLKMVAIVLLSNIIPLLFIAAIMGAMGIFLKADTAIIFAVSFGIVVDDSIHFINRFRLERSKGLTVAEAVRSTYLSTGKAMIITTMILLAGFASLIFSSFGGAFYIGLLVSLCLVIAVIVDLTLLPVLMLWFLQDDEDHDKEQAGERA